METNISYPIYWRKEGETPAYWVHGRVNSKSTITMAQVLVFLMESEKQTSWRTTLFIYTNIVKEIFILMSFFKYICKVL